MVVNPFRTPEWIAQQSEVEAEALESPSSGEPTGSSTTGAEPIAPPQPDWGPAATGESPVYGKPICSLGVNISLPAGRLPPDQAQALEAVESGPDLAGDLPRPWPSLVYNWQPAATRHNPLYFEEVNAERYGYGCCCFAQPFVSTAHFFGTIPALPYLKASNCPRECVYTLGHYRAGSCPPRRFHCWPCDVLGGSVEAGTIAWMIFVIP